jgi:hypothetical protein
MKTNAEKLAEKVARAMQEQQIPAILVTADREKKRTGVVMDVRKENQDMNISFLLDAALNGEPTGALLNVVMETACILCANLPELEHKFYNLIDKYKKAQKPVTPNKAEA